MKGERSKLALLGDDDDLAFFDGLFDDLPDDSDPLSSLLGALSTRGHRRHQRYVAMDDSSRTVDSQNWRKLAVQQKHNRSAAENENIKLRELLHSHARVTKKMTKLIQKAVFLSANTTIIHTPSFGVPYTGPSANISRITAELDALARSADAVLGSKALTRTQSNAFAVEHHITTTPFGDAFEATAEVTWLLPFDIETITTAIATNALKLVTRKGVSNVQTICANERLKIIQGISQPKEKNGVPLTKHGYITTRQEPQRQDGSNLVLMACSSGLVLDDRMVVTMQGHAYILVSPVLGHERASLGPLSCVRWYRYFCAQPNAAVHMPPIEHATWMREFTTRWKQKAKRNVDKGSQAMENLLLVSVKEIQYK